MRWLRHSTRILDEREKWPRDGLRARAAQFSYEACADGYARLFRGLVESTVG